MIILRNKQYTDNQPQAPKYNFGEEEKKSNEKSPSKDEKAKKAGEILGTAAIGAGGTLAAGELLKKGAEGAVGKIAGKKARSEYREYLKGQDYRRLKGLEQIEAKRKLERAPYEGGWFKKNRFELKSADYVAEGRRSRLEDKLKAENLAKKKDLIAKRDAKIAKAGKFGKKVGLIGGTAFTAGLVAGKILNSRKKGKEDEI